MLINNNNKIIVLSIIFFIEEKKLEFSSEFRSDPDPESDPDPDTDPQYCLNHRSRFSTFKIRFYRIQLHGLLLVLSPSSKLHYHFDMLFKI